VAGLARVAKKAYPDPTSWDPKSDYYDPRSKPEKPLWMMVDVEFVEMKEVTVCRKQEFKCFFGLVVYRNLVFGESWMHRGQQVGARLIRAFQEN
jgi:hypothetical protein